MLKTEIQELAIDLMSQWGLLEKGWTFDFFKSSVSVGRCRYGDKKILFSTLFLATPEEEIKDVLLHEIAHALAGYEAAHGPVWKKWAVKVGCKPEVKTKKAVRSELKWVIYCTGCELKGQRSRKIRDGMYLCNKCKSPIKCKTNPNYGF